MSLPQSNVPPDFQSGLKAYVSGGSQNTEWFSFEKKRSYTNAFIICGAKAIYFFSVILAFTSLSPSVLQILLGYKKRGFGKGLSVFPPTIHYSESPDKLPG